ncbi:hypothetical protein T01_3793 [Trichinella spiralis]|uniref:PiggyBac transposable element-derived protein domain-containing protein n=1 Tax=Trichinella spiralis TaxID=6334 RepID=A0A0V1BDM6_TRISP|nr:hypothetical protein T01_3793 [Trichinella spiralis]
MFSHSLPFDIIDQTQKSKSVNSGNGMQLLFCCTEQLITTIAFIPHANLKHTDTDTGMQYAVRFGYKVWLLCGNHGYPCHMITSQGKEIHSSKVPFSTRVISNIVDIIQENSNTTRHTLYFDNFFNNYEPLVNTGMGEVDLLDRLGTANRPTRRSKKWSWPLFINVVNVATVGAWRNHCFVEERSQPLRALSTSSPELAAVRTNCITKMSMTTGALPKMQRSTTRGARKAML